jgi:hypothetical protein
MVVPHRRLSAFLLLLLALARLGLRRLALRGRKQRAKVQRGRGGGCCTVGAHCARGLLQAYHHPATSVFRDKTRRHTGKSQSTRPPNSTRSGQRPPATLPIAPPTRAETARHGSWAPWQLGAMAAGHHGSWAPWQLGSPSSACARAASRKAASGQPLGSTCAQHMSHITHRRSRHAHLMCHSPAAHSVTSASAVAAAVRHPCSCIGSPCLRHSVHSASIAHLRVCAPGIVDQAQRGRQTTELI